MATGRALKSDQCHFWNTYLVQLQTMFGKCLNEIPTTTPQSILGLLVGLKTITVADRAVYNERVEIWRNQFSKRGC